MDKMKRLLMIGAVVYAVTDCAKIPVIEERDSAGGANVTLSVEEARSYFETEYPSLSVTRSDGMATEGWMSPGDITPKWDKAVASAKGNTASVDVPVIPTYRYRAIRSEYSGGRAKAYSVDVWQKLVIVRKHYEDGREEKMGQYILTLIPDKGYAGRHKGNVAEKFVNTGDKGSYSGLAVYYCRGVPMRMDRYVDGQKVGGISVFGETDATEIKSRLEKICRELGKLEVLRSTALLTRTGEDNWEDDWDGDIYGGWLDPSIVYEDAPDPGWYEEPETDSNEYGGMTEGDWDSGWMLPEIPEDTPETPDEPSLQQQQINTVVTTLTNVLGNSVGEIKNKVTFTVGNPSQETLTSSTMKLKDVFDKSTEIEFKIQSGLDKTQLQLILAHEFMHLQLLEISRTAGSPSALGKANPELMGAINRNGQDVNAGHHEYMGSHIDELEDLLRQSFPGQNDKFYEYGKWGGGAFDSSVYDDLSASEQEAIELYLKENELMVK